jgi:hypothetical protein
VRHDELVKKIAQSVAKYIFGRLNAQPFTTEQSSQKIWTTSAIKKTLPKINIPFGRKFAQSGHPAVER